jgi:hypothetical protein
MTLKGAKELYSSRLSRLLQFRELPEIETDLPSDRLQDPRKEGMIMQRSVNSQKSTM